MEYKIFAINPGSTSTKITLFQGDKVVYSENVSHDSEELKKYENISDQLPYRRDMILKLLLDNGVSLENVDAFVGRGGGLLPLEGGTYEIDELILDHARRGANGISHPAQLGSQIANEFVEQYGGRGFVVNPPDVDELQEVARITGIKDVYRNVHLHALNLKETAIRHSQKIGRKYEESNYIVCHIGGGISISAHKNGKMIDGLDIVGGEGPMAPTRCGSIPVIEVVKYLEKGNTAADLKGLCTKSGGFVSHLGISDAKKLFEMGKDGDKYAKLVWDAMLYQIVKGIGTMSTVLEGKVHGILLGGGMVFNEELVETIKNKCSWISEVTAYPGEFEMEALASGAIRVLSGLETPKKYTGIPVFTGVSK